VNVRALAALGILMSVPEIARADVGSALPLELGWEVPESCPNESFVRRRIEQIVHGPALGRTVVVAKARIAATAADRFELSLTLRTGDLEETKVLEAPACSALAQATATIIALAIDSSSETADAKPVALSPPSVAVPERGPPSVPAPERRPETAPPPPKSSPRSWSFAPGAFSSLAVGTLPEASVGFGMSAAFRLSRLRLGLVGTISLPQSPRFAKVAGASFDMIEGGAWGAYVVPLGRIVAVGPSVNVEATYVRSQAFGIRASRGEQSALWPTLAAGGRLESHLTRWLGLVGRAEVLFALGAPAFSLAAVDEFVPLHEPSVPALRLSLGVEIVLP
jgi:hypothetical protein